MNKKISLLTLNSTPLLSEDINLVHLETYEEARNWLISRPKGEVILSLIEFSLKEVMKTKATYIPLLNTENVFKEIVQKIYQLGQIDSDEL